MDIVVYEQEQQKKSFYSIMGYYFASLDIKRELEAQLYNKNNSTWFLGYEGEDLVGFCTVFNENKKVYFDNFYILQEFRNKGYGSELFEYMIDYCNKSYDKKIETISKTPEAIHLFEKAKFEHTGDRGRYKKYCLDREEK